MVRLRRGLIGLRRRVVGRRGRGRLIGRGRRRAGPIHGHRGLYRRLRYGRCSPPGQRTRQGWAGRGRRTGGRRDRIGRRHGAAWRSGRAHNGRAGRGHPAGSRRNGGRRNMRTGGHWRTCRGRRAARRRCGRRRGPRRCRTPGRRPPYPDGRPLCGRSRCGGRRSSRGRPCRRTGRRAGGRRHLRSRASRTSTDPDDRAARIARRFRRRSHARIRGQGGSVRFCRRGPGRTGSGRWRRRPGSQSGDQRRLLFRIDLCSFRVRWRRRTIRISAGDRLRGGTRLCGRKSAVTPTALVCGLALHTTVFTKHLQNLRPRAIGRQPEKRMNKGVWRDWERANASGKMIAYRVRRNQARRVGFFFLTNYYKPMLGDCQRNACTGERHKRRQPSFASDRCLRRAYDPAPATF